MTVRSKSGSLRYGNCTDQTLSPSVWYDYVLVVCWARYDWSDWYAGITEIRWGSADRQGFMLRAHQTEDRVKAMLMHIYGLENAFWAA